MKNIDVLISHLSFLSQVLDHVHASDAILEVKVLKQSKLSNEILKQFIETAREEEKVNE